MDWMGEAPGSGSIDHECIWVKLEAQLFRQKPNLGGAALNFCQNTKQTFKKVLQDFAKASKFRQIWSHWSQIQVTT